MRIVSLLLVLLTSGCSGLVSFVNEDTTKVRTKCVSNDCITVEIEGDNTWLDLGDAIKIIRCSMRIGKEAFGIAIHEHLYDDGHVIVSSDKDVLNRYYNYGKKGSEVKCVNSSAFILINYNDLTNDDWLILVDGNNSSNMDYSRRVLIHEIGHVIAWDVMKTSDPEHNSSSIWKYWYDKSVKECK